MLQQTLFPVIFLALICHAFAEESCPHFREDTGCPCATKYAEPGVKYYSKAQSKFFALARCHSVSHGLALTLSGLALAFA